MQSIELIRFFLHMTDQGFAALVADLRSAPLTQPTSRGGNHPLWILGHLSWIEGGLQHILLGKPNPVEHWTHLFAPGSTPTTNAADYPSFDELLKTFRDLRASTVRMLDQFGEERLSERPMNIPPGFEEAMATVGQTIMLICMHQMVHYGQITDVRRVAGLKPLF